MTIGAGVDVMTFGGTKNGMMMGEAIIFFNPEMSKEFKFIRKQGMQLLSKMRFVSAQFIAYLEDDLWLKNAKQANDMAKVLEKGLREFGKVRVFLLFFLFYKDYWQFFLLQQRRRPALFLRAVLSKQPPESGMF